MLLIAALLLPGCSWSSHKKVTNSVAELSDNVYLGLNHLGELYKSKKLVCENAAVSVDDSLSNGLLISGTNAELSKTRFAFDEEFDFDSAVIQRIMINGLGQKDCITKVNIYLDNAEKAVSSITLNPQDKDGEWNQDIKNVNEIVSGQNITGKHKVEFSVCQYLENGEINNNADAKVLLESIQFVAESIPLINIRIDESQGTIADMNDDETHQTKCTGEFDILVSDDYVGEYSDSDVGGTYELSYIKGRGNSTWTKGLRLPYKIKLAEDADLFGMGSNANWALLANAYDNDLIRNAFTYKIGEELDMPYTPQCVCVDVVMNGEYLGNYTLCENIRVDSERIEINDLDLNTDTDNITGGYLIGAGSWGADEDAYVFTTSHGVEFNVNSPCDKENPKYDDEMEYIVNYMQRIENALYGEPNPETGAVEDPFDLMDMDSAIKYYWIQELSANGDFCKTGSTYCYKDKDGKLCWGPIWDYDVAWAENDILSDSWKNQISWFQVMLCNEEFAESAKEFYTDTLKPLLDEMLSEDGYCNKYYQSIKYSAINNHTIWGFRNEDFTFNKEISNVKTRFEECHKTFIESVKHRVQWCADNLNSLKTEQVEVLFYVDKEIYTTRIGYINTEIMSFPDDPEISGKRFLEWDYNGTDLEGNSCLYVFNQYVPVPADALEEKDGKKTLVVTATFEDRDSNREVKNVKFQQSSYNIPLDATLESNNFYLPIEITPSDGYTDEIVWSVADDSVVEVSSLGNMLDCEPKKSGSTIITATLMNGTTYSVPITVTSVEGNKDKYKVTDFKLSEDELTLHVGDEVMLGIEVLAPDSYLNIPNEFAIEYEWSVESGESCIANGSCINAEAEGTSVVVCKNTASGEVRKCTVTVIK